MTRAERDRFKKALQDFFRDSSVSEDAARKALGKTGIFTKKGRIARNYGGQLGADKLVKDADGSHAPEKHGIGAKVRNTQAA